VLRGLRYDPDAFRLLASIYGGTHPALADVDPPARRLAPLGRSATRSVDDEERESDLVAMEFDNRGCDCAWKLYWLTPDGTRQQYGEVRPDASYLQTTFKGHVWQLEAASGAAAAETHDLRYAAAGDACVAPVKEDANCRRAEVHAAAGLHGT
jgi:hypothetical protein